MAEKEKPKLSSIENLVLTSISGVASGSVAVALFAPLDRVKLLLQCQSEMLKQGTLSRPYNGIIDCVTRIFRNEGLPSFWRGGLVDCIRPLPRSLLVTPLNFALKDRIKSTFKPNRDDSYLVHLGKNVASGGVAGVIPFCFLQPLDYARTRLANDVKSTTNGDTGRKYNGLVDVWKKTWATDGIVGLYRGFVVACVGVFIYRGCYFGLYDTFKPILLGPDADLRLSYLFGYGVTVTSGFLSYPIDTIRRRMMMTSGEAVKYSGSLDCVAQIIRNEGITAFFKGFTVNFARSLAGAGLLAGFDKFVQFYTSVKVDTSGGG